MFFMVCGCWHQRRKNPTLSIDLTRPTSGSFFPPSHPHFLRLSRPPLSLSLAWRYQVTYERVDGHGMNLEELGRNPRLDTKRVRYAAPEAHFAHFNAAVFGFHTVGVVLASCCCCWFRCCWTVVVVLVVVVVAYMVFVATRFALLPPRR